MSKKQISITLISLFSLALLAVILGIINYFLPKQENTKSDELTNIQSSTQKIQPVNMGGVQANVASNINLNNYSASPTLQQRLDLINKRNPNIHMTAIQLQKLMDKPTAWQVQDDIVDQLKDKLEPNELKDGRKFIAIDPMKIETLLPNDNLQVNIPQLGKDLTLKIEDISVENGITSWQGKLINYPDLNTVSITQGGVGNSLITQIGLNTPEGFYVVEGFNTAGWIVGGGTKFNKGEMVETVDENGTVQKPEFFGGHENDSHSH